jgi:hypothetical protein
MKKIILLLVIFVFTLSAQTYKIEKLSGSVQILDAEDKWIEAEAGMELSVNSIIVTGEKSFVKISAYENDFTLKGNSALSVSGLRKISFDELLLALAMEDMLNAPRKKEKNNGSTTAVYGTKEGMPDKIISQNDFGIMRLKGAVQLAEGGFKESALLSSKEIFRKYPEAKKESDKRIYFANLLHEFGLYEEAFNEYKTIKELNLSEEEKKLVDEKISVLNKKLVNK